MGLHLFQIPDLIREALNDPEVMDPETGELLQPEVLEKLDNAKERIVLWLARYAVEEAAESLAVKMHSERLAKRSKAHENKAESLKRYIAGCCEKGEKFSDDCVKVSVRESTSCDITDPDQIPAQYFKTPEPIGPMLDRAAVLKELRAGYQVKGTALKRTPFTVIS